MPAKTLIFLDLDGVLFDFRRGAELAHGRTLDYTEPRTWGEWDFEKLWDITAAKFWEPINMSPAFWSTLPKTAEADSLVGLAEGLVGQANVCILTAPASGPFCIPGKKQSLKRHFPQYEKKVIFTGLKGFVAGPGKILVDDRDKNCEAFRAGGGQAVLVPRMWNSMHALSPSPMHWVMGQLGEAVRKNG